MPGAFAFSLRRELLFLGRSGWDLAMLTWIPLLLLGLIAVEMGAGVMRDLPIAVVDADGSGLSRELTRRLDAAPGLAVVARPQDMTEAERLVRTRSVYAVMLIPAGTERDALRGTTGTTTLFFNASYSTAANAVARDVATVVQAFAAYLAETQTAAIVGPRSVRAPPVTARTSVIFNPQGSYELQLVALLHPALLHLIFMQIVVAALGRELRDGTIGAWLPASRRDAALAVAGKLAPAFIAYMVWAVLVTGYLAGLRGWPVTGSVAVLLAGYAAMYLGYIGVALLLVGISRSMSQSLSLAGLYAGASFAFAGAIFPVASASGFARWWSALLPYSAFARLLAREWIMAAPLAGSLRLIGAMLLFLMIAGPVGLLGYAAAARRPAVWGRR